MTGTIETADEMRQILQEAKVVAVVGHSDKPDRTSYQIAQYLRQAGYKVYPVNPTVEKIDGEPSYATLADVPEKIDIVNVFRRPEHLPGIVRDAIEVNAPVVWAQLGVVNNEAVAIATDAEIDLIMNHCIKVEHRRLL